MKKQTIMAKKKIQPRLRFKDDNGNDFPDWEEKTLGEISEDVMYGVGSAAIPFDGEKKYIRITDIDESSRRYKPDPLTSPEGEVDERYKVKKGDILFARTGASVGKSYLYRKEDGNLYFAGFLIKFSIKDANPYFIYSQTLTEEYNKWVQVFSMRSGQPGINAEEYKALKVLLPSVEEQNKIAEFLSAIDDKIDFLEKQLEELKAYKKGVMQAIFASASDATERRLRIEALQGTKKHGFFIRFKDENGNDYPDWEWKKIEDVAMINTGNKDTQDKEDDGLYPFFVRSDNVERINSYAYDGEAILTSGDGVGVGKNFHYINGKFNYHQRVYSIHEFKGTVNGKYVFYYFSFSFYKHVIKFSAKNSVDSVRREMITKMPIPIPALDEQNKIASFLSALDEKINYTIDQIKNTRKYKQGIMQVIFSE
jgi:type I restriction enzyme S subunit